VTLERGESHLLTERLQLRFHCCHFLIVTLALGLNDVSVLELLELFVELLNFS
jgi:hypothetical protein